MHVEGQLLDLAGRYQGRDGDQAAIPRGEVGAPPQVAEEDAVGVLDEGRRDRARLAFDGRGPLGLLGRIDRKGAADTARSGRRRAGLNLWRRPRRRWRAANRRRRRGA
jgi:hypothetical protein